MVIPSRGSQHLEAVVQRYLHMAGQLWDLTLDIYESVPVNLKQISRKNIRVQQMCFRTWVAMQVGAAVGYPLLSLAGDGSYNEGRGYDAIRFAVTVREDGMSPIQIISSCK